MNTFDAARERMVREHLSARGIRDPRVLQAMGSVPRHLFVEGPLRTRAYEDSALPIGQDQTISQPWIVARMTELLCLGGKERVLEIGTGSGYQAAVLAALCGRVYTVERHSALTSLAKKRFGDLGLDNILCRTADGTIGWSDHAPFDRILVTAGAPELPQALARQLGEGGILVIPVGDRARQELVVIHKRDGRLVENRDSGCAFVPLVGREGWKPA